MHHAMPFRPLAGGHWLAMAQGCPLANAELPIPDNFAALAGQTLQSPGRIRVNAARELCQIKLEKIIVRDRHPDLYLPQVFRRNLRL